MEKAQKDNRKSIHFSHLNDKHLDLDEANEEFILSTIVDLNDKDEKQKVKEHSINYHREAKEERGREAGNILIRDEHQSTTHAPNDGVIKESQRYSAFTSHAATVEIDGSSLAAHAPTICATENNENNLITLEFDELDALQHGANNKKTTKEALS